MILDELAEHARFRVEEAKCRLPIEQLEECARSLPKGDFPFEKALRKPSLSFICEVKKASPSKGIIVEQFPYRDIAKEYEATGADAVSVLTEPKWFLGSDAYLKEIAEEATLPLLRKDFTVDLYQIYEAKTLGASAVLLICTILSDRQLRDFRETAEGLGLSALVEAHTAEEVRRAAASGASLIGVNNRDLKTFQVDLSAATSLRSLVPPEAVFVSESGLRGPEDAARAAAFGADAVLVGEAMMKAPDKAAFLASLREAAR